jgi:hypothetical protein
MQQLKIYGSITKYHPAGSPVIEDMSTDERTKSALFEGAMLHDFAMKIYVE